MSTQSITNCVATVPGCQECADYPWRARPHECDDLCDVVGERMRADEDAHQQFHEPSRHECGTILDDRRGNNFEIRRVCGYRTCIMLFCPGCRRWTAGWGPVGCRCNASSGHGTWAEFPRPGVRRLRKRSIRGRR